MVQNRDQRKNPGIRDVDRVTWGNLRRSRKAHLGVRVFVYPNSEIKRDQQMYKRKEVTKLTGSEQFTNTDNKQFSVLDFWQYGFSNLNSNVLRGALAEFLVETALKDVENIKIRNPWGDYDVEYEGKRIEVKCCSYLQDWDQKKLSRISWSGLKAKMLYWNDAVSKLSDRDADYKADVYVLALLKHKETETLDILDLNQWCFYVLSREDLKEISGDGNSVSLYRLQKHDVDTVPFKSLKERVEQLSFL